MYSKCFLYLFTISINFHLLSPEIPRNLVLNRVILASDENSDYLEFWPIAAKAWKNIVGLTPTLFLITDNDFYIDDICGEVIRIKPIAGIKTSLMAQVIRLLGPALFPEDGCLVSDIDMIPLQKDYFFSSIKHCMPDSFIVYRDRARLPHTLRYPMCYLAGLGKTFGEVFDVNNINDIVYKIEQWSIVFAQKWETDELALFKSLKEWKKYDTHCVKLGHYNPLRILRFGIYDYSEISLKKNEYVDIHCPRPYSSYKSIIDEIVEFTINNFGKKNTGR